MPSKVSIGLGKELYHLLTEEAKRSGRHLGEQVHFLLEIMFVVIDRQPDFPLCVAENEITVDVAHSQVKVICEPQLVSQIGDLSRSYGLSRQQLIRTLLLTAFKHLGHHHGLARKEVLIEEILGHSHVV